MEDEFERNQSIFVYGEAYESILPTLVWLCMHNFNDKTGKNLTCETIVRVVLRAGEVTLAHKFYITFLGQESPDGPLLEYRAKAKQFQIDNKPSIPLYCKPSNKPSDEAKEIKFDCEGNRLNLKLKDTS